MQRVAVLVAAGQIWLVKLPSMLFTFRRVRLFVATAIHPLAASSIDLCSLFSVGRVCFFFVFFCRVAYVRCRVLFCSFRVSLYEAFFILGRMYMSIHACIQVNIQTRSFTVLSNKTSWQTRQVARQKCSIYFSLLQKLRNSLTFPFLLHIKTFEIV